MRHFIVFISILFFVTAASAQQGWVQLTSGTTEGLDFISIANRDTIYISGSRALLRTTDGGSTWERPANAPTLGGMLQFIDDTTLYLCGATDSVHRSNDGGQTWQSAYTGLVGGALGVGEDGLMAFASRNNGCVISGPNLAYTKDAAKTWQQSPSPMAGTNCMVFADSEHGFAGGRVTAWTFGKPEAASFSQTNDGGVNWFGTYPSLRGNGGYYGIPKDIFGMAAINIDTLIAVGLEIAKSTDGGNSWDTIAYGADGNNGFFAVTFPDYLHGTAVGSSGWIFHTTDGGQTWVRQDSPYLGNLGAVAFLDSLTGYACGSEGAIIKTTNGGLSWVMLNLTQSSLLPQSYPQPANEKSFISYTLPSSQRVSLSLNGLTGATVSEVLSNDLQDAGPQLVTIDTSHLASGTYAYVLKTEKYYATGKIIVIH
jgi:photosystem II stability/assembly factor-like uncharacterized protein